MKKGAAFALVIVFAACLAHFYFSEDHCPVHCPNRAGGLGHVHPHHPGASVCQCFLVSLSGPESGDLPTMGELLTVIGRPAAERLLGRPAAAVTPPPRASIV